MRDTLEKLSWGFIQDKLVETSRAASNRASYASLQPNLDAAQIRTRWDLVGPYLALLRAGYSPPVPEIGDFSHIFRAIKIGQLIAGTDLREIYNLLIGVKNLQKFCGDFSNKYPSLRAFHAGTYPLPRLLSEIEKTVGLDGELLDTASPELKRLRGAKVNLRRKIETAIKNMFRDQDLGQYVQDDFYTIRAERYVIPIRLDGRGRIIGSIYDTSDSGHTLFIEPTAIAPLNEELLELELSEKIEVIRIFREILTMLQQELEILERNYSEVVQLDALVAEAKLSKALNANSVSLCDYPKLNLINARHPQLLLEKGPETIANCIALKDNQCCLILSGPNAGGKTVILRTAGLLTLMVRAGLMIPADADSEIFPFANIFLELGDSQNISQNLSTFSGHVAGLKPILLNASQNDLVLLDELAAGTEPVTGACLAQSILEDLRDSKCMTIVTTHYDSLKFLAVQDTRFRNGSMEFDGEHPTYRLLLDLPGQSYGLEIARSLGLKESVLERAATLKGNSAQSVDAMLSELSVTQASLRLKAEQLEKNTAEVRAAKDRWEEERKYLTEMRKTSANKIFDHLVGIFNDAKAELQDATRSLRKIQQQFELSEESELEVKSIREKAATAALQAQEALDGLSEHKKQNTDNLKALNESEAHVGATVFVPALNKNGKITSISGKSPKIYFVQVGMLRVEVGIDELRMKK